MSLPITSTQPDGATALELPRSILTYVRQSAVGTISLPIIVTATVKGPARVRDGIIIATLEDGRPVIVSGSWCIEPCH